MDNLFGNIPLIKPFIYLLELVLTVLTLHIKTHHY
ncbi:MAG: hypothetical protein CM15mV54_620 [Caudoviricetes sp.]|nr:MAG: hypothetical protein CM15mV54_620 [Caudoviricetes sp.]